MSVSLRQLKAECRFALLSQLDVGPRAAVLLQLGEIVGKRPDLAPESWMRAGHTDTLCVLRDGELLGAVVIESVTIAEPLVLAPEAPCRPLVFDLLWQHLEGLLLANGQRQYYFRLSEDPEWSDVVKKAGAAEMIGGDKKDFYCRRIFPEPLKAQETT